MTLIQKILTSVVPASWARDMREESQRWMMRCACGHEISVWDAGGVRWKASGHPVRLVLCPKCGSLTPHTTYRKD